MPDLQFEFHATVVKVEERFRKVYDREKVGNAKTDAQMTEASEDVSTGWWVSLSQYGIAVNFGPTKPDIDSGDTLVLIARKLPKQPPKLEAVPAPVMPPLPSLTAAELTYIRARLADDAMHERGPEDLALSASIRQKLESTE